MSKDPTPTLFQIISTDYLGQNFFVMIFAGWVFYFIDTAFEGKATSFLLVLALVLTPIGLLAFHWRYHLIVSTIVNGMETTGHITEIEIIASGKQREDRILHYEYNVNGQTCQYRNRVKKNTYARSLKAGQPVTLPAHEKKRTSHSSRMCIWKPSTP